MLPRGSTEAKKRILTSKYLVKEYTACTAKVECRLTTLFVLIRDTLDPD